ncbi:MAG: M24 family metallopeptidase [Chlamydiales bacterium]|nr:M24 family metallopeptidase [Chlamydiales bacterium]
MDLQAVQQAIADAQCDGWLLYDFRRSNDLACRFLDLGEAFLTRRFFYWIPRTGDPIKIVSIIEPNHLDHLPGKKYTFRSWQDLEQAVVSTLSSASRVAMEYSPRNGNPYVSKVDAGTIELVRGCGVKVVSSADILAQFTSVWDDQKLALHYQAAEVLDRSVAQAWKWIASGPRTDYGVQQYLLQLFLEAGCVMEGSPICAINADSADPHFMATEQTAKRIRPGDFILIDLWCKRNVPNATYADITRVGFYGDRPSTKHQEIFSIVKSARDAATDLVIDSFARNNELLGWQVDQCARDVINAAGYGEFFTHRTGHNIDEKDHGDGAHLDNLETQDQRRLLTSTCFSIEPGIYLPGQFGVRLEYDIYIHTDGRAEITGGIQETIHCISP